MKARAYASIVLAGLLASGVAGCTFVTPIATQNQYDASDGVSVTVGDLKLLNALVITDDSKTGNLIASAINSSDQDIAVQLQYDTGSKTNVTFDVPADGGGELGSGEGGQVLLPDLDTKPGSLLPIYVQYGDKPGKQILVPVLNNSLSQYRTLTPTPTPTPTEIATPTPTPTPTP